MPHPPHFIVIPIALAFLLGVVFGAVCVVVGTAEEVESVKAHNRELERQRTQWYNDRVQRLYLEGR